MTGIQIAASILSADFTQLGQQVQDAEAAGAALIHIDVMDGRFVPNITMGPQVVTAVRRVTTLPLDVHLMIVEPERFIDAFAQAGADRISVHYETSPNLHRTLQTIRAARCQAGVALNPHTPAAVLSGIMDMLDLIIVMTVNPGFGGQAFLPTMMPKVAELRAMIGSTQREITLEVDGGINANTVMVAAQAGATVLIAGSAIFNSQHTVSEGVARLQNALV